MAACGKRQREAEKLACSSDEDDLLAHLDAHHQEEYAQPGKRRHNNTRDNNDNFQATATEPLWQESFRYVQSTVSVDHCGAASQDGLHESDDGDLLGRLDTERIREQRRLSTRRSRLLECERIQRDSIHARMCEPTASKPTASQHEEPPQSRNGSHDSHDVIFDHELGGNERADCMNRLRQALGAEGLDECVCAACDRLVLRRETRRVDDNDWTYMDKMKRSLKLSTNVKVPDGLIDQYRAPPHLPDLEGTMVSPRGIHCYMDDTNSPRAWLSICSECDRSLEKCRLPKFSIANGFYVGRLGKDLRGLTLPERLMTQLASILAVTRVMRGGRHRCIGSHCIAFDCTPGPPILLLPRSIEDVSSYRVVMVGAFTPVQSEKIRKMHRIRNLKVREVFKFYRENNHLYANVKPNEIVLNSWYQDSDVEQNFLEHVDDSTGELDQGMTKEQENTRGQSDVFPAVNENEEASIVERRMGLSEASAPVMAREHPVTSNAGERQFEIRRSDKISNDASGDLFARIFPHLFPFGRGHPGESRVVNVSVQECVKYYTMLSERQFAEDELFSLVAFDRIALRNMYINNHFRCLRYPNMLDGYESLTGEQLGRAILDNERRRQGCLPWRPQSDCVAQKFLTSVEIGSRSLWGSNAERSQCRHKALAYQTRFGQPALFVTLTPNTDNSLVLGHYAGILSVESLFDVLESRLPTISELKAASLKDDCASTRLFMRQVDAFIKHALGIDPVTKRRLAFRGLFGDVKAYFGMVETQGRGTLHIHMLIWLNNCPSNSIASEHLLNSPSGTLFQDRVASYTQSIVSNNLPIGVEKCGCSQCGAPFSELVGLRIPDSARKDPIANPRASPMRRKVTEPALIQCTSCNFQFSSQHLLRSALLRCYPNQWPPWKRPLSQEDVKTQAVVELSSRGTMKEAVDIIDDREKKYASLVGDSVVDAFSSEQLHQQNCAQNMLYKNGEDAFRSDPLTRLFEVSPPSAADERMDRSYLDYMVSALAVQMNQHLWNHTTSCFKQSKSTTSNSCCRYGFPRELVDRTSFTASGVELSRKLGHEYINGFNYEIMATFRCNHDIQVLLGGSDVTDRIYYCCKYVTKYQKRLDSQVAVAVGALKRRQEREQIEFTKSDAQDRLVLARKRVACLMYNLTNRQEIAGPLAALYLYRGSCCYSSASCESLHIGDMIRQLTTEEYTCTLVKDSDNPNSQKYHAVSSLDDYIYRPKDLQKMGLYEFTMWYFRKKSEKSVSSKLSFLEQHPLHESHCLGKRYTDAVPVIQGFRMPSDEGDPQSKSACKRAVLSLVLFKPFRNLEDLVGISDDVDEEAWLNAFAVWSETRSKFAKTIMNNMQDYYSGVQKAASQSAAHAAAVDDHKGNSESDYASSDESDDVDRDDVMDPSCGISEEIQADENMLDMWENGDNSDVVLESSSLNPAACPSSIIPEGKTASMLTTFQKFSLLHGAAADLSRCSINIQRSEDLPSVNFMKKWVRDASTDNTVLCRVEGADPAASRDTQVVELLTECLLDRNMAWKPCAIFQQAPKAMKSFASISEASTVYTLNERQHYALKVIGRALLSRWRQAEMTYYTGDELKGELQDGQLLMFLGGEGGTGKSRIIDAVQALCESWGRPNCLVKTALTGKAATLISGRTLASFLLQIKREQASDSIVGLELIIIDEVSMMKKFQLAQLDVRLRQAKRVPGVLFGGVHVILVGDFLQLPPVGGTPLYKDPNQKANKTNISPDELAGFNLWQLFVDVIMLKESVRFQKDPEWGRGCAKARLGVWTQEFVDIVNSRVIKGNEAKNVAISRETTDTFVTPDNMTRVAINSLFISTAAKLLPEGEYPVRVVANFQGKLRGLNREEIKMVMGLPDSSFGRMAPYLDLIVGMPIQVSQNVRAEKMVANGTLGHLEAIIYHPGTTFRLVHDCGADMTVKVPSIPPPSVLVRLDRGSTAVSMRGCSDPNIFPLFFETKAYKAAKIALPGSVHGVPRELSVNIQQLPLVCAVSSTVYKVQGETLNSMVVTEWRSKNAFANKKEQPYLLVSRVTAREAFTSLQELTAEIIAWAHPPQAALDEEERLNRLSNATIAKLTSTPTTAY